MKTRYSCLWVATLICVSLVMVDANAFGQSVAPQKTASGKMLKLKSQYREALAEKIKVQQEKSRVETTIQSVRQKLDDIAAVEKNILKSQEPLGISTESFPGIIGVLQTQKIQLTIDLAGLNAKRKTLLEIKEESAAQLNVDLIKEMEAIIEGQEVDLQRLKRLRESRSVSSAEVKKAELQVIASKHRLASMKASTGSNPQLQNSMIEVSLDIAESEARLNKTIELLDKVTPQRNQVDRLSKLRVEQENLTKFLAPNEVELKVLEVKLEAIQSDVKMLKMEMEAIEQ